MPRGNPVDGVGIVRYPDAVPGQLVPKSYRPRTGGRRGLRQLRYPTLQLLGRADEGLPDPLPARSVERGEDLAAASVADGESIVLLRHTGSQRVERADAGDGLAEGGCQTARGCNPDPQSGERARPEADGDQVDRAPAPCGGGAALDLPEQGSGVLGAPFGGGAEQGLAEDLAVAPSAGGGVLGRGIEADDYQRGLAPRP